MTRRAARSVEFRVHCEAPGDLAGGMALQSAGRIAVGLPRLAYPSAEQTQPRR